MKDLIFGFVAVVIILSLFIGGMALTFAYINKSVNNKNCAIEFVKGKKQIVKQYLLNVESAGDSTTVTIYDSFLHFGAKNFVDKNIKVVCE